MPFLLIFQIVSAAWPIVKEIAEEIYKFYATHKAAEAKGTPADQLETLKNAAREQIVKNLMEKGFKEGDARIAVEVCYRSLQKSELKQKAANPEISAAKKQDWFDEMMKGGD